MAESSRTFNFDSFDEQIVDALEDNEVAMSRILRPGQIGAVVARPTMTLELLPDLPSAE